MTDSDHPIAEQAKLRVCVVLLQICHAFTFKVLLYKLDHASWLRVSALLVVVLSSTSVGNLNNSRG